jgi:hypothetical protein
VASISLAFLGKMADNAKALEEPMVYFVIFMLIFVALLMRDPDKDWK